MTSTRLIVRPVEGDSIRSKKFKKLIDTNKHFALRRVHPLVVIADLRRGCLDSLNQYLRQEKGNLDRGVMVELRKLISGSRSRTDFRIMVVQHPDSPKDKGGRPGSHLRKPVKIEFDAWRQLRWPVERQL
jgi:hypothetical protein